MTLIDCQKKLSKLVKNRLFYSSKIFSIDRRISTIEKGFFSPVWFRVLGLTQSDAKKELRNLSRKRQEASKKYDQINKEIWEIRKIQEILDADKQILMF